MKEARHAILRSHGDSFRSYVVRRKKGRLSELFKAKSEWRHRQETNNVPWSYVKVSREPRILKFPCIFIDYCPLNTCAPSTISSTLFLAFSNPFIFPYGVCIRSSLKVVKRNLFRKRYFEVVFFVLKDTCTWKDQKYCTFECILTYVIAIIL